MDFYLVVYILLSIITGVSLYAFLYNRGQNIGAMILFVLLIAVFAFFGLRWFEKGKLKGSVADPSGNWPPIVNICPDFMATTKPDSNDTNNAGDIFCTDINNIYNLGATASIPYSSFTNSAGETKYGFKIFDSGTGVTDRYPLHTALKNSLSSLTGRALVRWEGVYDGRIVNTSRAPKVA
jgi:hypothetical protein